MMRFKIFFRQLLLFAVLLPAAGTTGCTVEDGYAPPEIPQGGDGGTFRLTLTVPVPAIPVTRGIAGEGGESVVGTLDLLLFDNSSPARFIQRIPHADLTLGAMQAVDNTYEVTVTAGLATNADVATVAAVANVPAADWPTLLSGISTSSTKAQVLEKLTFSSTGKWNTSSSYTAVPMYGELAVSGITEGTSPSGKIQMLRMLARIDLVFSDAAYNAFTTIDGVYLVNYNTAGYIARPWDSTTGVLQSGYAYNPAPPASNVKKTGESNALLYPYNHNGGTGTLGEIYAFEAPKTTLDADGGETLPAHKEAVCLIIKGTLASDSKTYWYRVDFTTGTDAGGKAPGETGFDPATVAYMPLYRNHLYALTVQAVNGRGYESFDEALESKTVLSNLKTWLLVVDEKNTPDISYNGQYYLATGRGLIDFLGGEQEVKVITNYHDGWESDAEAQALSPIPSWLTVTRTAEGVRLTFTENRNAPSRTAVVCLKSGRLRHRISVTQEGYQAIPFNDRLANSFMINNAVDPEPFRLRLTQISDAQTNGFLAADWIADADLPKLRAQVYWSDVNDFTSSGVIRTVVAFPPATTALTDGWVAVFPGTGRGNALVILYTDEDGSMTYTAGDTIKWSWHIWNTDYHPYDADGNPVGTGAPDTKWMNYNLGAVQHSRTGTSDFYNTVGLFYQWGRKDPVRPGTTAAATFRPIYAVDGTTMSYPANFNYAQNAAALGSTVAARKQTYYNHTVANPLSYCLNTVVTHANTRLPDTGWGYSGTAKQAKGFLDPCPYGWRVPARAHFQTTATYWTSITMNDKYGKISLRNGGYYPVAGQIVSGALTQSGNNHAAGSYHWTAEQNGTTVNAYVLNLNTAAANVATTAVTRINAHNIRCVKDE